MLVNLLLEPVQYRVETTRLGSWRRFLYPDGRLFAEYRSHARLLGLPLLHYTCGICPETGRRRTARGIVAVGRRAIGVLAIGQLAAGGLAVGHLALGLVVGLGQAAVGLAAIGQLALGWHLGLGQAATGHTAVGQVAYGEYVLAQIGVGAHVWDQRGTDPEAAEHFHALWAEVQAHWRRP